MKQNVLAPAGDEDIVEAVVIVVADGDSTGPYAAPQPRLRGDVGKRAVAVVAIEADDGLRGCGLPAAAGQQDDILPTVVVIIEERHAASHGVQNVVVMPYVSVDDGGPQAGFGGDVDEMRMKGQS